jgi:hypothetical protein
MRKVGQDTGLRFYPADCLFQVLALRSAAIETLMLSDDGEVTVFCSFTSLEIFFKTLLKRVSAPRGEPAMTAGCISGSDYAYTTARSRGTPIMVALFSTLASAGVSQAAAAPQQLYGKSLIITWTEERMQRHGGETQFRPVNIQGKFSVYISSAGRIFNRVSMTNRRQASGSADRVGNTSNRSTRFQGNIMTSIQYASGGGARRIVVTFASNFGSCTADVIRGKASNSSVITAKSIIYPGMVVEIQSVHTSEISCSVRNGNVFGGE